MDRHFQPAFLGGEMRDQPGQLLDFLVGRERQDEAGAADGFQFDDLGDFDLAHIPVHPAPPDFLGFVGGEDAGFRARSQWIIWPGQALSGCANSGANDAGTRDFR
jgi:hypothetical protein